MKAELRKKTGENFDTTANTLLEKLFIPKLMISCCQKIFNACLIFLTRLRKVKTLTRTDTLRPLTYN